MGLKYVKKPVVVEAYKTEEEMFIETLEGTMKANVGDYIITGVNGEQYPCKPDVFHKTYKLYLDTPLFSKRNCQNCCNTDCINYNLIQGLCGCKFFKNKTEPVDNTENIKWLIRKYTEHFEACQETCFDDCVACFLREEYGDNDE